MGCLTLGSAAGRDEREGFPSDVEEMKGPLNFCLSLRLHESEGQLVEGGGDRGVLVDEGGM